MKIWIDDIRPAPFGYLHLKTVNEAIKFMEQSFKDIEEINLDHDAGDFFKDGGDYIKVLDWIEAFNPINSIVFCFHTMNPVGRQNMIRICKKNGWCVR